MDVNRRISFLNIGVFAGILTVGGIWNLSATKEDVSEMEKRELMPFPSWSLSGIFTGGFTDSLDLYYSDHFVMRDQWVDWAAQIKSEFGQTPDVVVYRATAPVFVNRGDSVSRDSAVIEPESGEATMVSADSVAGRPGMSGSVLIYNNAGFQLFGRGREAEKKFAGVINQYKEILGDRVRVFACVVPSSLDFYLPEEHKSSSNLEKPSIDAIYAQLSQDVIAVDAYTELADRKGEYLYFKSDHHWTARGAYYGYRAFCEAAGLGGVPLSLLKRQVRKPFYGSLYYLTRDPRLKESKDSMEFFQLPIRTVGYRYPDRDLKKIVSTELVSRSLAKAGSYLAFIGGDYPLTRYISAVRNGRKILVVKDSYGNALVPFLPLHYQEVWIIDYRSFDSNLLTLIRDAGVNDLLFLHSVAMANSRYTSSREWELTKAGDLQPKILPDTARWTQ